MKRRCFIFFVLLFLCLSSSLKAEGIIKVVTTTSDLASIAQEIGKDRISVVSLSRGTQDPHFIEVRPSMVVKLKSADLLILVGMNLDIWVQSLIDASRNPKISYGRSGYLDASAGIKKLEVPQDKIDASMGHLHIYGNPHYWLDPLNGKIIASNIAGRLAEISPQDASYFQDNLLKFNRQMDEKITGWEQKMAPFKGQKIVTYHRSWPYFTNRFDLIVPCEIEPKPGIPPSPKHLKEVIEIVKREKIRVILMEVFYDEKPAAFIAGETDAKVVVISSSVGGTKEAKDYFSLTDIIIERLVEALR